MNYCWNFELQESADFETISRIVWKVEESECAQLWQNGWLPMGPVCRHQPWDELLCRQKILWLLCKECWVQMFTQHQRFEYWSFLIIEWLSVYPKGHTMPRCWRVRRVGSKNVTVHFWLDGRPCGNYLWVVLTLNLTVWAESTLLCSEVYCSGYQRCTSDTDGILISTGFVPNIATQYFSPRTGTFSLVSAFRWQHCTFHPEQAHFDSYVCFDDNNALFTLDGYIFTHHLRRSH